MAKSKLTFTRDDYDRLKEAQRRLHDLLPRMDKAEQCGVECQGYREIHAELTRLLGAVEREYMGELMNT